MKKTILATSIGLLLSIYSINSNAAGVGDLMSTMFQDTVTNATPGDTFNTQRSGVITGGRFTAKNHISRNMKLIGFVPPSISAGCGGISAFGGSFSFINGDQLVSYLRDIGTNAVGYFFQLALESSCPTCAGIMNKLNDMAAAVNGQLGDSCSAAKTFSNMVGLDTVAKGIGKANSTAFEAIASPINTALKDPHAFLTQKQTGGSGLAAVQMDLNTNVVWKKLRNSGFDNWVATSSSTVATVGTDSANMPTLTELAMSLVGTSIYRTQNVQVNLKPTTVGGTPTAATREQVVPEYIPPILTFKDFWGTDTRGDHFINFYRCANVGDVLINEPIGSNTFINNDACIYLTQKATTFKPFRYILNDFLVSGNNSIAIKVRERKNTITVKQDYEKLRNFVSTIESPVYAHIQKLSVNKTVASSYIADQADFIALSYVSGMLNQVLEALVQADAAGSSFNKRKQGGSVVDNEKEELKNQLITEPLYKQITEVRRDMDAEYAKYSEKMANKINNIRFAEALLESIRQALNLKTKG